MKVKLLVGNFGDRWMNETRYSPPSWMRHVVSWKLLRWLDKHLETCWANLVMWKMGYDIDCWWPSQGCFEGGDYCNKYTDKPRPRVPEPVYVTLAEGPMG